MFTPTRSSDVKGKTFSTSYVANAPNSHNTHLRTIHLPLEISTQSA